MKEVDRILYKMGYFDSDPHKRAEIQGYLEEAEEFMKGCGVTDEALTSRRAYVIKSIWADARDRGNDDAIVKADGMVVSLISQLRGGGRG